MRSYITASALALCLSTAAVAADTNSMSVTGVGVIQVQPDLAVLTVTIASKGKNVVAAQTDNNKRAKALVEALTTRFSIDKKDYRNSVTISQEPVYTQDKGQSTLDHYENVVRASYQFKIRDLNSVGQYIDAAGAQNPENVSVAFGVENSEPLKLQALTLAGQDAVRKAQAIIAAFPGRKLGNLMTVSQDARASYYEAAVPMAASARSGGGAPTEVNAGTVSVTASVSVVFSIN